MKNFLIVLVVALGVSVFCIDAKSHHSRHFNENCTDMACCERQCKPQHHRRRFNLFDLNALLQGIGNTVNKLVTDIQCVEACKETVKAAKHDRRHHGRH